MYICTYVKTDTYLYNDIDRNTIKIIKVTI